MSNRSGILPLPGFPEAPKDGLQYARRNAAWVQNLSGVTVSATPPPEPLLPGQLWWDSTTGDTYLWYDDGNSKQWVQQNLSQPPVIIADSPPAGAYNGQIWWDSNSGNTYIRYDDGNSQQWVQWGGGSVDNNRVLYSRDFDGATISDRVTAAIAMAVTGDTIDANEGGTHTVTTGITILDKGLTLDLGATELIVAADVPGVKAYCTPLGPWALSADYVIGSLNVPMNAMDRAPKKGEWFMIFSEAIDPANRDKGSDTSQARVGERFMADGGTTTSITLRRPLRFVKGVEIDGSIKIDSYTLAKNARVLRYQDLPFALKGGTISHVAGSPVYVNPPVRVMGWVRPVVDGTKILYSNNIGFGMNGNILGDFCNLEARNLPIATGYGVALAADTRSRVKGMVGYDNRHTVTENSVSRTSGTTNLETIISSGRSVGALIEGCASYDSSNSAFDTHHGATDWTFRDNFVDGSAEFALYFRGQGLKVDGLTARNCAKGVRVATDYQDGAYMSGIPEGLSYAQAGNLDVECDAQAFSAVSSKVELFGYNRFISKNFQTLFANAAEINVYGTIDHKVVAPAADNVGAAMFLAQIETTLVGEDFETAINFMPGSMVKVNALAAISSGACSLFETTPGGFIRVRGAMDLALPNFVIQKYSANMVGSGSTACFVHGDMQQMQITGPGAALLDLTRRGFIPQHLELNDKSQLYEYHAVFEGLADDVAAGTTVSLVGGVFDLFLIDYRAPTNLPVGCSFTILDPTISSVEYISLISTDTTGLFQIVVNADLTTANVTDGKIGITYKDSTIWVMARLGQAAPLKAALRGWGMRP